MARPFRLLVRHFLRRFLDNDLVSPNADSHASLALLLAFLVAPNLIGTLLLVFRYGNPWITPCQTLILGLNDKVAFLTTSMILTALATVVQWDALGLDRRDHAILTPLPVPAGTLVWAKLTALGLFAAALACLLNLLPTLFFPFIWLMTLPIGLTVGLRVAAVHAIVSLAAATFAFVVILGVRSLLAATLPQRLFRAASSVVQFAAVVALVTGFLLSPALYHNVGEKIASGSPVVLAAPPVWFLGAYEWLTARSVIDDPGVVSGRSLRPGQKAREAAARRTYLALEPAFRAAARRAAIGLAAGLPLALGLFALAHLRPPAPLLGVSATGRRARWRRRLTSAAGLVLAGRHPVARGTFFFTLQALARSARHRLYVAAYLAGGVAIVVASQSQIFWRGGGAQIKQLARPEPGVLALQLVLLFALVIGVRVGFPIPAELPANWVFRLTEAADLRPAFAGARRAFRAVAIGCLLLFVPLHAALWGWDLAGRHFLTGTIVALVLVEALMVGFQKVPFTSAYVPGNSRLRYTWPLYLFFFWVCTYLLATIEFVTMQRPRAFAAFLAVLGAIVVGLAIERWRRVRGITGQVFDEAEEAAFQTLGLTP